MSLLSSLIAELSALVERSRESRTHLSGAGDRLERVLESAQNTTVDSSSALVTDALVQLRSAIGKLEEAQRLLSAGDERWQAYIALLAAGAGVSAGTVPQARPPLSAARSEAAQPIRGPARHGIRSPTPGRHRLTRIGRSSQPAEKNTVILPSVDVEGDLAAIRTGRAHWNADTNRYEINGRSWGVEPNGTVFPASGPGLVELSRSQFKALKTLNTDGQPVGIWPKNYLKDPSISSSDWDRAAEIYRYHPRHSQGAT
ncbi:hypothetical protein [Glycomyces harbinensis]|uniref:Uncharacterized protein n=1 Tax=Glycomyces harbinensis TaxID=58114 RepID=A0A1G6QV63_9ACTN|nr:hypothetical protein [Glycomyces harbinensis]SDC95587.1 hypothetical protein SAMN05216270_101100 [Glycomyces harbinensis]